MISSPQLSGVKSTHFFSTLKLLIITDRFLLYFLTVEQGSQQSSYLGVALAVVEEYVHQVDVSTLFNSVDN